MIRKTNIFTNKQFAARGRSFAAALMAAVLAMSSGTAAFAEAPESNTNNAAYVLQAEAASETELIAGVQEMSEENESKEVSEVSEHDAASVTTVSDAEAGDASGQNTEETAGTDTDAQQVDTEQEETSSSNAAADAQETESESSGHMEEASAETDSASEAETESEIESESESESEEEGMDMPAQTFVGASAAGVQVQAIAVEGVFPADTTMTVTDVSAETALAAAEDALGEAVEDAMGVDISFYDVSGNEIEPTEGHQVIVTMALPDAIEGDSYSLVHTDNDGVSTVMEQASVNENGAVFMAEAFSPYIVAGETLNDSMTGYLTPTLNNVDAIMIGYHEGSDWRESKFLTLVSGEQVEIRNYKNSSTGGYILIYVKPQAGYLITGFVGEIYPIDGPFKWEYANSSAAAVSAEAKNQGYVAVFGFSRRPSDGWALNTGFTVSAEAVGLTADVTTEVSEVVPGQEVEFAVTLTPTAPSGVSKTLQSVTYSINGTKYDADVNDFNMVDGSWVGTVKHTVTAEECAAGAEQGTSKNGIAFAVTGTAEYSVAIKGNRNSGFTSTQTVSANASTSVSVKTYNLTLQGNSDSFTYDGKDHQVTGFTIKEGEAGQTPATIKLDGKSYTVTATAASESKRDVTGSPYPVTFTESATSVILDETDVTSLFNFSYEPGTMTITPADMTVSGTSYEDVYDGKTHGEAAVAKDNDGKAVTDGTTISYSTDGGKTWSTNVPTIKNAGVVTVAVKAENANYKTAENSYTLKVTPRQVTVTADPAEKVAGENDPVFTAKAEGMVAGDEIVYSVSRPGAGTDEAVGIYKNAIVPAGDALQGSGNYEVTYTAADFEIKEAPVVPESESEEEDDTDDDGKTNSSDKKKASKTNQVTVDTPNTGDRTPILPYAVGLLLSMVGMFMVLVKRRAY